jgi:hypothetical protein
MKSPAYPARRGRFQRCDRSATCFSMSVPERRAHHVAKRCRKRGMLETIEQTRVMQSNHPCLQRVNLLWLYIIPLFIGVMNPEHGRPIQGRGKPPARCNGVPLERSKSPPAPDFGALGLHESSLASRTGSASVAATLRLDDGDSPERAPCHPVRHIATLTPAEARLASDPRGASGGASRAQNG